MTRDRRTAHQFDVRLGTAGSRAGGIGPARGNLIRLDKERTQASKSNVRELKALRADYRGSLSELVGPRGMRQLRELRNQRSKVPRSRRIRRTHALLDEIGIDRAQLLRLQRRYVDDARALLSDERLVGLPPVPGTCESPWVTYTAPFSGYLWSFWWQRSSNPDNPVLARHLDNATGRIGSSIQTRLSDADDDDFLTAEYYTALNVWHTALASGPLEAYLAFEFNTSTYSGEVKDEFGFSDATYTEWARARFLTLDSQGLSQTQESRIFNTIDVDWGDGDSWSNYVFTPRDIHWYYFKTTASYDQGTSILLEAGIRNMTWFEANDESVKTAVDLDLRLDRIMVRSCTADIIL